MSISAVAPFDQTGQYTGSVDVQIYHNRDENAYFIKVEGERVALESFHGNHIEKLQSLFGQVVTPRDEFQGMKDIYQDAENMKLYGAGVPFTDGEIAKRIEANAKRFISGDPFGRFKVINQETNEIIGFAALGHGYIPGESQAALILAKKEQSKKCGKEVAILVGALAQAYFYKQYEVGSANDKQPVFSFTATAKDNNLISKEFLASLGLVKLRELTAKERLSDEPTSLYGIEGDKVIDQLHQLMDIQKLHINIIENC